jgi:DNA-directed RNA polymerase subunit H (RpoH/RPB5)
MKTTDAIARIFGAKEGQVFEITRPTGVYFRIVKET